MSGKWDRTLASAQRVAHVIATFKVLSITILMSVALLAAGVATFDAFRETDATLFVYAGSEILAALFISATIYVTFGWFEHTLSVLVAIADQVDS